LREIVLDAYLLNPAFAPATHKPALSGDYRSFPATFACLSDRINQRWKKVILWLKTT
jgi:hypothetical protein